MGKRSSHVLTDEKTIDMGDFRTVVYGKKSGVYRVTVRGMYHPTVENNYIGYIAAAENADRAIRKAVQLVLSTAPNVHHYTIVETDLTIRGHKIWKPAKIRYTFFARPVHPVEDEVGFVKGIVDQITPLAKKALEENDFEMSAVPEPDTRHCKKKKQ